MSTSELFTIFPVFLLIDVSASMSGGPIEAVNKALPDIQHEMRTNPMVGEIARISVVTFSDDSRIALPMCDLAMAELPELMVEGGTNFAAGFRGARQAIESGIGSLPKGTPMFRPVVFFMTDGAHQAREDWTDALNHLRDKSWKFNPEIVAFGLVDAHQDELQKIATRFVFMAKDRDPVDQVREIISALMNSIRTTSTSLADPSKQEGLYLDVPSEHFTALPAMTA